MPLCLSSCTLVDFCGPYSRNRTLSKLKVETKTNMSYTSSLPMPFTPHWLTDVWLRLCKPVTPTSCQGHFLRLHPPPFFSSLRSLRSGLHSFWVCGETEALLHKIFHQQQQITTGSDEESTSLNTHTHYGGQGNGVWFGPSGGMLSSSSSLCEKVRVGSNHQTEIILLLISSGIIWHQLT